MASNFDFGEGNSFNLNGGGSHVVFGEGNSFDLNESAVEQEQSDRRNTPGNNDSGGEDHNSGVSSYAHPIIYTCSLYYRPILIMFTQRHNWSLFYIAGNDVMGEMFLNEGAAWLFITAHCVTYSCSLRYS